MKTAKEILSEYKPDTRSVHMNDVAWCTEKVLRAMDAYAAQFQQPPPEVKRDKYGVILSVDLDNTYDDACRFCKYIKLFASKVPCLGCDERIESNEYYKPE